MKREEFDLERRCCIEARKHGIVAVKLEKNAHTGIPDYIFIRRGGKCLYVEFKKPGGGKISKSQEFYADFLGGSHHFVNSLKDFLQILNEFLRIN